MYVTNFLAPKHLTCDAQNRHPKFFLEWNAECLNKETYGGQIVTEQKNVSLLSTIMWPVEESTNLDELLFPWEFPFLDLRSEGLSNLVTLSEPRFARSDNRSTLLDIIPSSLRSRKVKILPRKVKFILVCIPLQAAFCLQEGIYIPP